MALQDAPQKRKSLIYYNFLYWRDSHCASAQQKFWEDLQPRSLSHCIQHSVSQTDSLHSPSPALPVMSWGRLFLRIHLGTWFLALVIFSLNIRFRGHREHGGRWVEMWVSSSQAEGLTQMETRANWTVPAADWAGSQFCRAQSTCTTCYLGILGTCPWVCHGT